eukprot:GHUV01035523.1.p1 GENE.GHUV01035523.1~~GHUV01035523.1.p1  ORF type:complete len:132 (-),score=26.65 GHUV01035523.1:382-777(-)
MIELLNDFCRQVCLGYNLSLRQECSSSLTMTSTADAGPLCPAFVFSSAVWSVLFCRSGTVPGLDELYLTTMDTIESITPNDALFMVQGSVLSQATDRGARDNKFGLSAGDWLPTDYQSAIAETNSLTARST